METIEILYNKLKETIQKVKKKKMETNSVVTEVLNMTSNTRLRVLIDSSFSLSDVLSEDAIALATANYIQQFGDNKFVLTVKGILYVEESKKNDIKDYIFSFIQDKFFLIDTEKKMTEKEKLIILCLLACRSFSIITGVDIWNKKVSNIWEDVIEKIYTILKNYDLIRSDFSKIYRKNDNHPEKPLYNFFRHSDNIPKLTDGLFKSSRTQQYYLDLAVDDEKLFITQLSRLFKKIFNEDIDIENRLIIAENLNNISREYGYRLHYTATKDYCNTSYDDYIKRALLRA